MNFFQGQSSWDTAFKDGMWDYLSTNPVELSRQALVASQVFILGSTAKKHRVLELGCGTGALSQFISKQDEYVGIDISTEAISAAKICHPQRVFLAGDIGLGSQAPFMEQMGKSYDFIILNEVVYYLKDDEFSNLCALLQDISKHSGNPHIIVSMCRTDLQTVHHSSYYWARLFENFKHQLSIEVADSRHRWDIKIFQGARELS